MNIYNNWVVQAWRKEDADRRIIQFQKYCIIILFVLCLGAFIGWCTSPSRLTVYIPPDIQNGSTVKVDSIPPSFIYSFAYEIWQEINYWPQDGDVDFKKNIHGYWSYLTPQFKTELLTEYEDLKSSGQVQRIRFLQGLNGAAYDSTNIKKLSSDSWEVDLKMRLTEYKNNQSVKDVEIIYPLKIVRTSISNRNNPYGLVIAGFLWEPKRITTYI